ncbi:TIGR03084 family metal-binding protein [Azospirillum doebereinerae]
MLPQIRDFDAEVQDLAAVLEPLAEAEWDRVTLFKGWTINDVILHLHASDVLAIASARSTEAYASLRADMQRLRASGLSMIEESRLRFPGLRGRDLLDRWRAQADELCDLLVARDPKDRLDWAGPGMSVRMFATARQMETWAHGQEIHDALGLDRIAHDRIENIATIGVKTFGWSFLNRNRSVPDVAPHVALVAPSGRVWAWNEPNERELISGRAVEFCQVVTQVRNVADTKLVVRGDAARSWMAIAQCFAGPPVDPPAPGTRRVAPPVQPGSSATPPTNTLKGGHP